MTECAGLDDSQRAAVSLALSAQDIALIHGAPRTLRELRQSDARSASDGLHAPVMLRPHGPSNEGPLQLLVCHVTGACMSGRMLCGKLLLCGTGRATGDRQDDGSGGGGPARGGARFPRARRRRLQRRRRQLGRAPRGRSAEAASASARTSGPTAAAGQMCLRLATLTTPCNGVICYSWALCCRPQLRAASL